MRVSSNHIPAGHSGQCRAGADRRGVIFVLSAFLLVVAFAFAAFAIDLGYITLSKAEIQKTSDAAVMASVIELGEGWSKGPTMTPAQIDAAARLAARDVAAANRAASRSSVYLDQTRDVRFGQYQYNSSTGAWTKAWGVTPYNLAEVTVHRDQAGSTLGDAPVNLFFAPVMGTNTANLRVISTSALMPGVGVKVVAGSSATADVLPIALDLPTWTALMNGTGPDAYRYNANGSVSTGSDGIREVNIYPEGSTGLPPGNRGTVDFGSSNNSTADISRQIRYGLNANDLSYFGGQLSFANGPLIINGDTGISAGIKDDLDAIIGKPRLMPIFTQVSGPGNNAMYTIVKFVGVRIVYSKLTGSPSSKKVYVQPCPYVADTVITGNVQITTDTYFAPAGLIP
jgi:Flp pilus assembly protein TadG